MGRSRMSSLDSKRSSVSESSRTPYCTTQCPTVREYDAMGYLEPRQRHLPQYLQLLNHAPELELPAFQNARGKRVGTEVSNGSCSSAQSQHASAFRPVGPYSRAALGATGSGGKSVSTMPQSVLYSAVTSQSQNPVSSMSCSSDCSDHVQGRGSSSSSQTYGVVSVQDPQCCNGNVAERLVVDLTDLSRIKAAQRKFSDQDLYSSPAQFNQRGHRLSSASSTMSDHPYSRVLDTHNNNNCSFASSSSARTTPIHHGRERNNSGQDPSQLYCSSRGKPPSMWTNRSASESDSVFEQEEEFHYPPPPYINVQNGSRSRGQVYPENGGALAGFDIAQASLV